MASDSVLGWWGSDLRLVGGDLREERRRLEANADPAPVIAELLAGSGWPGRGPLRIIYQPDGPETPETAGADALRRSSRLAALAAAVAQRGRRVEGAWPLAALLEAASAPGRQGAVHLLATAERALVASASSEGGCWVKAHDGPDFLDPTLASLRTALARFDDGNPPGGMVVIEDGPQADALRLAARGLGPAGSRLSDLLRHAHRLVPGDASDLLPARPWHRRRSVQLGLAAAAGLALLAAGDGLRAGARRRERVRREIVAQQDQQRRREEAAAADRARQQAAAQQNEARARAECPAPFQEGLLRTVARELPSSAVLHRLVIDRSQFVLSGTNAAGGAPAAEAWPRFLRSLGAAENPWQMEEAPERPSADFSLRGRLRPAESPPAAGGDSARLAALCATFPPAAAFFPRWQEWSRSWRVTPGPTEEFPGFTIRHFTLDALRPTLEAWPQVVATVGALGRQPGVTIERLALVAGPDDNFSEAEIAVSVRLRP